MTYDPRTGRFIRPVDHDEAIAELVHELDMRALDADPHLYPGESVDDLDGRIEFHETMRDAAIAEENAEAAAAEDLHNWSLELSVDPDNPPWLAG